MTTTQPVNKFLGHLRLKKLSYHIDSKQANEMEASVTDMYDPNKTVYVGWGDENTSRYGSIGVAVPRGYDHFDRANWKPMPAFNKYDPARSYWHQSDSFYHGFRCFDVVFDKKRGVKDVYPYYTGDLYWLKGHTGGVEWCWNQKPKPEAKPIYDRLGNELKQGDFIAYVGRAKYTTGMGDLYFGFIEKTTKGGTIFAKNIKLSDEDKQMESRITTPDRVTKLDKNILTTLMMKRLTF